jgi:hypothetical protein
VRIATDRGVRTRRIVGLMVFPTLGIIHGAHTSLGTGAWLAGTDVPGGNRSNAGLPSSEVGPNALLIRLRKGHDGPAELATLRRHVSQMRNVSGVVFRPVQRPAEIVNTSDLDAAPPLLSGLLLGGSLLALATTLSASVRRRRHELAVLKTLGMTQRQVASMVSWQSTGIVLIGVLVGIPLGIAGGRWLWTRFAHGLDVVADPRVPVPILTVLAVSLLVVANLVAIVPGRLASRTSIGPELQAD